MGLAALALRRQRDQAGLSCGMRVRRQLPRALALATVLALQGCNGGSVVIASGVPASAAPAAAGTGQATVSVSAGNWFAGALVLVLFVANAINEACRPPASCEGLQWHPLFQPMDRGWVDRGP